MFVKSMRWLWNLFRFQLIAMIIVCLIPFLNWGVQLISGLLQQAFFNYLEHGSRTHQTHLSLLIWVILLQLLIAGVVQAIVEGMGFLTYQNALFAITTLIQHNLLEHIMKRPGSRAVSGSAGGAVVGFRDDPRNILSIFDTVTDTASQTIFAIVAFIIMLRVNMLITLLVILPLALVILVAQRFQDRLRRYHKGSLDAASKLTSALGEFIGSVQAIQIAGAEPSVLKHFEGIAKHRRTMIALDSLMSCILSTIYFNTTSIGTGLILVILAVSEHGSSFQAGDLALFTTYMGIVAAFVQNIGNIFNSLTQTNVSFERLGKMMEGAPDTQLTAHQHLYIRGAEPPALLHIARSTEHHLEGVEACDLTYHYPDTGRGIEGVNLSLKRGTLTVLTGRIGSGKTTCLQALLGLLERERGEVLWNGEVVSDPGNFFVPPRSAYTAQVPHLFSDPLKDNILLGLPEDRVDLERAVRMAVMERDVETLEKGLDTLIGTRGVKLSGGQAQRTAAARMLVRDAELLVFDDLSSALDVETERILWERLFASGEQHTFLVVSHRRHVLQLADHIIVLRDGHVEAEGDLPTLLERSEEMRRLWHGDLDEQ